MSHDVAVSYANVANANSGQGDLLMTAPVAGRLPRTNGRSQLTQFITVRNTLTPAGLPSGADGPLKRMEVVPKKDGEVDVGGPAYRPFVTREVLMSEDKAEENQFVVG